jgi:hypothetical protein
VRCDISLVTLRPSNQFTFQRAASAAHKPLPTAKHHHWFHKLLLTKLVETVREKPAASNTSSQAPPKRSKAVEQHSRSWWRR